MKPRVFPKDKGKENRHGSSACGTVDSRSALVIVGQALVGKKNGERK